MSSYRIKKRRKRTEGSGSTKAHDARIVEYYQIPFAKFHQHPAVKSAFSGIHKARSDFWSLIPFGSYADQAARELLSSYIVSVERKLAFLLREHSIAYWLHTYRRLSPGAIESDDRPMTISLVRATLEVAIQKYGVDQLCTGIGNSTEKSRDQVLRGALDEHGLWEAFEPSLRRSQLVLTDFGPEDLAECYLAEKLAFEIWKATATLRSIGKGATLRVRGVPDYFGAEMDDELRELLRRYDQRTGAEQASATGTVFSAMPRHDAEGSGFILLPVYNSDHEPWRNVAHWAMDLVRADISLSSEDDYTNFMWVPFDLGTYYRAHLPFSKSFCDEHGLRLESVLAVIAALATVELTNWRAAPESFFRSWQRAYVGPITHSLCI